MTPPTTAADAMALGPALAASIPPVAAPDMMEFQGSSCAVGGRSLVVSETAIAAGEQTAPDGELPPHDRSPRGAVAERAGQPRPLGGLEGALPEVPYAAPYGPEGEGAANVLDYPVRARIAVGYGRVPHCFSFILGVL